MEQVEEQKTAITARCATAAVLLRDLVPLYIDPVPALRTFKAHLDRNGVPKLKANPTAKNGGGTCFYSVSATEKLLRRMAA